LFIKFFKSSFFSQYLAIGVIGLSLWLRAFYEPPSMPQPYGPVPLYSLLYDWLSAFPLFAVILGFLLVLIEMFWLNVIFNKHELILKNSTLAALVFIIFMSFYPELLILHPVNITVLFIIIILNNLLISYKKPEHLDRTFAAGFSISIASMFYFPFILWFGLIPVSFLLFRSGKWRQWVSFFIGLLTPYLYLVTVYFWLDILAQKTNDYILFARQVFIFPNPFQIDFWILTGFTLIFTIYGLLIFKSGPTEKTAEIRAKINLFLWIIIFCILSFIFSGTMAIYHPALANPAFALIVSSSLMAIKKPVRMEWLLIFFFLMILINNLVVHQMISSLIEK